MRDERKIFIVALLVCLFVAINLFLSATNLFTPSSKLVGDIFNLQSQVKNWGVDLLYLDKAHAQLLLKKGLPIVRVADDRLIKESKDNKIVNFASKLLFDLPPSFFNSTSNTREVAPAQVTAEFDNSDDIQEKMKAEGHHQGEKVELDFWQTESTQKDSSLKENKREDAKHNFPNDNFSNREQRDDKKIVGIYHTHTAENYENRGYNAHAKAGETGDVIKVGEWMKDRLTTEYNITVLHSKAVHDKTYDRSYIRSLKTAKRMVDNNSKLDMIFDIHRDAIGTDNKKYITTEINGKKVAKVMIVVTNNNYGLPHPEWQKNFRFAKKLASKMNLMYPGLLRKVKLISNRRYNQHVHPRALLLEVGGANSTLDEAKRASYLLAEVIAELMNEKN